MTQNLSNESRPPRPRRIRRSQAQNPPPVDGQVSSLPTTVSQQPEIAEQPPKTKKRGRPRKTTAAVSPIHSQPVIPQQPDEQPAEQLAEQPVDSQVSPPAVESAEQVISSPPEEGQLPPAQEDSSAPVLVVDQPEVLPPDSGQPLVVKQNVNIHKIFPVKKKSFPLFPYSAMRIFYKTIEKLNKIEFQKKRYLKKRQKKLITVAHANALLYETELQMIEDVSSRLVIMILRLDDPNYEFEKTLLSQVIGESLPQEEIDLLLAPVAPEPQLGSQVFASANPPLPLERQDSPFLVSPELAEELPDETSDGMVVLGSMEEFESLAGFEEIQELFERKVDGRKVPKKHYFEELKSYNTRQAESTKVEGQHNRYMFRWTEHPNRVNLNNPAQLVQCLEREGPMKDYYFQMEKGEETGKLHYQGFVKLSEKKRGKTLAKKLNPYLFGIELQAARAQDSICIDYVTKEDTRVSGPYTKLKLDTTKYPEVKPIIDSPYAWQSTVLSQLEENPPFRRINSIYDAVGNSGKTMFCKYLVLKTQGTRSPTYYLGYGRALDVKYALAKVPTEGYPRPLLFDFTRTKRAFYDMTELYSFIEEIKIGLSMSS